MKESIEFNIIVRMNPQLLVDWHMLNRLDLREETARMLRVECEKAIDEFCTAMDEKDSKLYVGGSDEEGSS